MDNLPKGFVVELVPSDLMPKGKGVLTLHPDDMPDFKPGELRQIKFPGRKPPAKPKKKPKRYSGTVKNIYYQSIIYFPQHLRPQTEKAVLDWWDIIEKLMRLDKIPPEQIPLIIKWARTHKFWKTNFLSMLKLRKKDKSGVMYIVVFNEGMKKNQPRQLPPAQQAKETLDAVDYLNM